MGFLGELLVKQRYPALLLLIGILLIFLGGHTISGKLSEPDLGERSANLILILLTAVGVLCIVGSFALFLIDEDFVAYRRGCKITETRDGFEARFRDSKICVDFGLLQELYQPSDRTSVVVLPANELFDKRCFSDERTAAGAFILRYFSAQGSEQLRQLVHEALGARTFELIETASGTTEKAYGVGTCVYLGEPLAQPVRLIFAAVASDRPPHGLRTDLSTIFKAVEEAKCTLATRHLSTVFIPLLGGGKGGVPTEIAFLTLLSALLEARCKDGGHNLREAHLVIFQSRGCEPSISRRRAKRFLRQLVSLYQEMSK